MRTKLLSIVILSAFVMVVSMILSTSPAAAGDPLQVQGPTPARTLELQSQNSGGNRVMVVTNGPVTEDMLAQLRQFGTIHGIIDTYNIVDMTLKGNSSQADVEQLSFVVSVEEDHPLSFTGTGMWDRDIINVVDVEESDGPPFDDGNPSPRLAAVFDDPRQVGETGDGVYVAVIDSGLPKNWRDFLHEDQVATDLARTITGGATCEERFVDSDRCDNGKNANSGHQWERDTFGHGIAVASYITGFTVSNIVHEGVAPDAKIIPLKVARNENSTIWESSVIAAIDYVKGLKIDGPLQNKPVVINISIAGPVPIPFTETAINDAISAGVIVVASAGNNGEARPGVGWPGAFDQVISVGAVGWTQQFRDTVPPIVEPNPSFWLFEDVSEDQDVVKNQVFVTEISSRDLTNSGLLDVLAPGENTVAPFGAPKTTRSFVSGTSFATPLVAGVAALMLDKNASLTQGQVESILKSSALEIYGNSADNPNHNSDGTITIKLENGDDYDVEWDDCGGSCDAVGAGLVQADAALNATP